MISRSNTVAREEAAEEIQASKADAAVTATGVVSVIVEATGRGEAVVIADIVVIIVCKTERDYI